MCKVLNNPERSQVIGFNNPVTHMPTTTAYVSNDTDILEILLYNTVTEVSENNHNFGKAEKERLKWYQR